MYYIMTYYIHTCVYETEAKFYLKKNLYPTSCDAVWYLMFYMFVYNANCNPLT